MDTHSFGREGATNFDDANYLKRMFEDPRRVPKHIDISQAPDDRNDMPSVWRRWIENIGLGIIISVIMLSALLYWLFIA